MTGEFSIKFGIRNLGPSSLGHIQGIAGGELERLESLQDLLELDDE